MSGAAGDTSVAADRLDRTRTGIAIACTTGNFVSLTPAVSAVFGLFIVPLSQEFGWARATVSGVLALVAVAGALIYPIAGRLIDRYGARRVILLGNLLFAPSIAALALANGSVAQFYFLFFLVGVTGAIPTTAALAKVVSEWFDARRGLMLGLAAGMGNGLGSTVMPIIASVLMLEVGWRGTYVGIGAVVLALGFPVMFFLLKDPAPAEAAADADVSPGTGGLSLGEAMGTVTFWLVLVAIALGAGSVTAVFTHVVPLLTDRAYSVGEATAVVSIFALVCAAWQPATGYLFDRIASPKVAVPMFLVAVAGLLLLQYAPSVGWLYVAGALLGIGLGAEFGSLQYFVSRYFGLKAYGAIIGTIYSAVMLAQGFTPVLMDAAFDALGDYELAMQVIAVALVGCAALLMVLPPFGVHGVSQEKGAF